MKHLFNLSFEYSETYKLPHKIWQLWILQSLQWLKGLVTNHDWLETIQNRAFFRSTFLKPVNGSKIWILNWFMKLNYFMCFSFLFLKNPWKIFHSIHLQTGIKENYVVEIQIVRADQNYIITVGKNDILTGRYFNVSLLSTACVC